MIPKPLTNLSFTPSGCFKFASAVLVIYVGALILTPFPNYFQPNFDAGFLRGKEPFFYASGYFLGFYAHIVCSPIALLCGTLQMSSQLRMRWPNLHRRAGYFYIVLTLCFVAPGGAVLSFRAFGGWPSTICFALISVLVWAFTLIAWRQAKAGRYASHGIWMCRSYLMMCSAVMLRLIHFSIQPFGFDPEFAYQVSAWLSWIPALVVFEAARWGRNQKQNGAVKRAASAKIA